MRAPIYQVDAFASAVFTGNPAAVVVVPDFPPDGEMQALAAENNLAETAFVVPMPGRYGIRWFTPTVEVPLCGHATLASAAVVMERLDTALDHVVFHSVSGPLPVARAGDRYVMDFPARACTPIDVPAGLVEALGVRPVETLWDGFNFVALLPHADAVRTLRPRLDDVAALPAAGVIVTAEGDGDFDCVSRYFAPAKGIPEDPVTGGAHCALTPFWAARLGVRRIRAHQASERGGELECELKGERVALTGGCVFFLEGEVCWS